jgi:cytidylate kinase
VNPRGSAALETHSQGLDSGEGKRRTAMAIITIRGTDSGGKALAESLAEELGYDLLSREELITEVAKGVNASEDEIRSALHQKPGFLEGRGRRKLQYVYCAQAAMARAVQKDDVVYHGQAGHLLLRGIPHHLRLKVVADRESRISDEVKRGMTTREEAINRIEELDRRRAAWMMWLHGVDANDPTGFDLVVNLEHISIPDACAIAAQTAKRCFQTTPESQKILDDLVLTAEIQAAIALDKRIADDRIKIEAKDSVVTITANVRSLGDAEDVRKLVQQIPGVREVQTTLGISR